MDGILNIMWLILMAQADLISNIRMMVPMAQADVE